MPIGLRKSYTPFMRYHSQQSTESHTGFRRILTTRYGSTSRISSPDLEFEQYFALGYSQAVRTLN